MSDELEIACGAELLNLKDFVILIIASSCHVLLAVTILIDVRFSFERFNPLSI